MDSFRLFNKLILILEQLLNKKVMLNLIDTKETAVFTNNECTSAKYKIKCIIYF